MSAVSDTVSKKISKIIEDFYSRVDLIEIGKKNV